jgi:uncharacterized membrane protein YjgN (DUF898 family)
MNASNVLDSLERLATDGSSSPADEPEQRKTFPFEFRGSGAEYFRIWIVNLLLTILTLGIFSAWAKVRRLRYFYGSTFLDGHSFAYHARPAAILKGRLLVFAGYLAFFIALQVYQPLLWGLIPLAAVGLPWVLMRSRRFQLRMTSWRNLRFGFRGRYGSAVNAFVGWHIACVAVLFVFILLNPKPTFLVVALAILAILYPFWVHKRVEYSLDNADYGQESFSFLTGSERFYLICGGTAVLSVAAYLGFFYALLEIPGLLQREPFQSSEPLDQLIDAGPKGWVALLAAAFVGFAIAGMYRAWFLNASFGGVMIRLHSLNSRVGIFGLIWIKVTNLLGILLTLGLYYPFAKVRQVRYQLEHMSIEGSGRFEQILAADQGDSNALGEEAGDFFNVDLGL